MKVNTHALAIAMSVATLLLAAACGKTATVKEVSIVPEPVFVLQKDGTFSLQGNTKISTQGLGQNTSTARYIMKSLRAAHMHPTLVSRNENDDITLIVLDTLNPEIGDEGYLLEVRSTGIRISANTEVGLFYGYQSFLQLLPPDVQHNSYRSITLPECTILDYPRFGWRGAMLDVSRHFFSVKHIKKMLDVMASYKLNKFHWHLTDDHGWRLPSEHYPQLNRIGSWRVDRDDQPWGKADPPRENERTTYGGYYSRDEIADVLQYAAARGIEVIPEIEMPGHASAILASMPQLACDNYPYQVAIGPYWPPKAILCAGNDSTLEVLYTLIDEVCDLFPTQYIHIGGDEAWKDNWEACPRCQRRIRTEHLTGEEQLQSWLMGMVQKHLTQKGKRAIGWDEMLGMREGGGWSMSNTASATENPYLAPDAVIMSWRGTVPGIEAAKSGHQVIMCPTEYCYLDYYQADARYQPASIGGMITLSKAYDFDPIPVGTSKAAAANVLGGQCNLWTEYINTPTHAEYMLLPRMLAISECLWSKPENKNWMRFRRKIEVQKDRLQDKGYNYCEGSFTPHFAARKVDNTTMNISIGTEVPNTYIFYTTDLSTPTRESLIYIGPINLERGTHIKILPVYKDIERDSVYEFVIN